MLSQTLSPLRRSSNQILSRTLLQFLESGFDIFMELFKSAAVAGKLFTATAHHEQVRARFLTRFEERRTGEDLTSGQVKSMSSDSRAQRTAMATSCMFCNTAFCLTRVAILNQAPNSGFLDDLQAVRGPVRRLERRSMPRKHGNCFALRQHHDIKQKYSHTLYSIR